MPGKALQAAILHEARDQRLRPPQLPHAALERLLSRRLDGEEERTDQAAQELIIVGEALFEHLLQLGADRLPIAAARGVQGKPNPVARRGVVLGALERSAAPKRGLVVAPRIAQRRRE